MDANATNGSGNVAESTQPAEVAYVPPRLERLGKWRALTLQQTIPISPDNILEEELLPLLPGL